MSATHPQSGVVTPGGELLRVTKWAIGLSAILVLAATVTAQHCIGAGHDPTFVERAECGSIRSRLLAPIDPKGKKVLAVSFGGRIAAPHVPWMTLPSAYGPLNPSGFTAPATPPLAPILPVAGVLGTSIPYTQPTGFPNIPFSADNPAVSGYASHANITRYWSSNPTYYIVVPPSLTAAGVLGTPNANGFNTTVSGSRLVVNDVSLGNPGLSSLSTYSWQNWIDAVNLTFGAYTSCNTASIGANFGGLLVQNYLDPGLQPGLGTNTGGPAIPAGVLAAGEFVWYANYAAVTPPLAQPANGPTGNGMNEIILTNQNDPNLINGIGLTSMLVDPQTGQIIECDVLISAQNLFQGIGTGVTNPNQFTVLRHEIGHFFGLEHTNLHSGTASIGTAALNTVLPSDAQSLNGSIANYPEHWLSAGSDFPIPGMAGIVTYCGGVDHTTAGHTTGFDTSTPSALHRDDATSLSMIYPVRVPSGSGSTLKLPLINTTARIIGRQARSTVVNGALSSIGVFGRNVWAILNQSLGSGTNPQGSTTTFNSPVSGTISGTARLSSTEAPFLADYQRLTNRLFPSVYELLGSGPATNFDFLQPMSISGVNAWTFANQPFYPGVSVLGSSGTVGGQQLGGTGDFSLDGLYAGDVGTFGTGSPAFAAAGNPAATGFQYDVIIEDRRTFDGPDTFIPGSGLVPRDTLAEWFTESGLYQGNPYFVPLAQPQSHRLRSFLGTNYGAPFSSLNVCPGSVIALDPLDHDVQLQSSPEAPLVLIESSTPTVAAGGNGVPYFTSADMYDRPVVDVQPRTFRPSPNGLITVRVKTVFPGAFTVDASTLKLYVNGVPVSLAALAGAGAIGVPSFVPSAGTSNPFHADSFTVQILWSAIVAAVGTTPQPGFPAVAPSAEGINITFTVSSAVINAYASLAPHCGIGRNDVIL